MQDVTERGREQRAGAVDAAPGCEKIVSLSADTAEVSRGRKRASATSGALPRVEELDEALVEELYEMTGEAMASASSRPVGKAKVEATLPLSRLRMPKGNASS